MSAPDERPPFAAVLEHAPNGRLHNAEVRRGGQLIAIMTLSEDLSINAGYEEMEAFDAQAERLCRLFAASERMEAACRRLYAVCGDRVFQGGPEPMVCQELNESLVDMRAALSALSEAARGEGGKR